MKGDWSDLSIRNAAAYRPYAGAFDHCDPSIAAFLKELGEVEK